MDAENVLKDWWKRVERAPDGVARFAARLKASPHAALREAGITVASDKQVEVLEDTATVRHVVARPGEDQETVLRRLAGHLEKLPEQVELRLRRDSKDKLHVVVPTSGEPLSDDHLTKVVG